MHLVTKAVSFLLLVSLLNGCGVEKKNEDSKEQNSTPTTVVEKENSFEHFLSYFPIAEMPSIITPYKGNVIPDSLVEQFIMAEIEPGYYDFTAVAILPVSRDYYTLIYGVDSEEIYLHYLVTFSIDGNPIKATEIAATMYGADTLYIHTANLNLVEVTVNPEGRKNSSKTAQYEITANGQIENLTNRLQQSEEEEFVAMFNAFSVLYQEHDTNSLKLYIHDELGYFILDNPGAFITVGHALKTETGHLYFDHEDDQYPYVKPQEEKAELPRFYCDKDDWDKKGCFWNNHHNENRITSLIQSLIEFEFMTEDYEHKETAKQVDDLIQYEVYNTKAFKGFYFGKIDGEWYLLCLDRISPCSA